jgi:hypothetical protein
MFPELEEEFNKQDYVGFMCFLEEEYDEND